MSSAVADTSLRASVLEDFDDPALARSEWDRLLARSPDVVFLTLDWQRAWWRAFSSERERLLIVLGQRDGRTCAIAPLFVTREMLCLVGSDGSDYLDFIGELDESLLALMLDAARRKISEFAGVALYHVPRSSSTTALLPGVAERLGLELHHGGEMRAPFADLSDADAVKHLIARRGVRKSEAHMRRRGPLRVRVAEPAELDEWLDQFLAQHASRWGAGARDGLRRDEASSFCRAIVHAGRRAGWLRFAMLEWQGRAAAFEITLMRGQRHLSYLSSRDTSIESCSPGAVLQAHVVRDALAAGARYYDFGLGDEPYKLRDATGATTVANWFLYPR
jgi:CelD/BcsL family acetyltransferase involved in cellulose biosynthesis